MVNNMPYVIINVATSLDGRIALEGGKRVRLSSPEDKARVHKLRAECDAIAVGINTVINDDPKLYVNHRFAYTIKDPIRVVFDSHLRIPRNSRVLKPLSDGRHPMTVIFASDTDVHHPAQGELGNNVVVELVPGRGGMLDLSAALQTLYTKYSVKRVMIEGGGMIIAHAIAMGLWNEMYIYIAPIFIGRGGVSVMNLELNRAIRNLAIRDVERLGDGLLLSIRRGDGE